MMVKNTKISLAMAVLVVFGMLLTSFPVLNSGNDMIVEAKSSPTSDDAGYTWLDSLSPDPKIDYEWIDATGGTRQKTNFRYGYSYYDVYYAQGTSFINLPFSFPFYGDYYNQIIVWPAGVMAFQDTSNGYAYYACTCASPWPKISSYDYYGPANAIAPWFRYYGGVQMSGTRADVFTDSGITDEGVRYWVCSWENVQCFYAYNYGTGYYQIYSGDNEVSYQAVLYENGMIRFNYKDVTAGQIYMYYGGGTSTTSTTVASYANGGTYGLVGIQNKDRNIGLTYVYNTQQSLKDGTSLMIKQFKTDISDITFSEGYGASANIYPATAGMAPKYHSVDANLYSERGLGSLTNFDMTVGAKPDGENVVLRYNFATGRFSKLNDPGRLMVISEERSYIKLDDENPSTNMSIHIEFDFNLWWSNYDPVNVRFDLTGAGVAATRRMVEGAFFVESRVRMAGSMLVEDPRGRQIRNGGWVQGNEVLHFTGIHREYLGLGDEVTPPDFIRVGLQDQAGIKYFSQSSDLDVFVVVDAAYPQMIYKLIFDNVTASQDVTPVEYKADFLVRIDSDLPGIPGDLLIYADSLEQEPRDYDDDREVYITWTDAVDPSSGVAYYYISVNKPKRTASPSEVIVVPKGTNAYRLTNLPEGVNSIYMWAEDAVGNAGSDVFKRVRIDLTPVYFEGFYPMSDKWITNLRPACSIWINDTNTGVDPLAIEYEVSTEGELGLIGEWEPLQETYTPDNSMYIVVTGWFKNGKDNWIRFRAKDVAGNGFAESEAFNVWVDASSPTYRLISPIESEYQPTTNVEVKIQIADPQSGVDFETIEYRVSTSGRVKFGPWMPYKDASGNPNSVEVKIRQDFLRGDQNYIQVRAKDLAGNIMSQSQLYNVKVNTFPRIVKLSPAPDEIYYNNEMIIFDATASYDPDGETVQVSWYRSGESGLELFGDSAYVSTDKFPAGQYAITIRARSGQSEVTEVFTLTVHPRPMIGSDNLDTDGDGLPDWWEIQFGTDMYVKDADKDPDGDGFTNMQEYRNGTLPLDPRVHPPILREPDDISSLRITEGNMPYLLAALAVIALAVIITMLVVKSKRDKAAKRIKAVRNMRKIMPSVSWEHITAASYMAAASSSGMVMSQAGPALPGAAGVSQDQTLPPAPESVAQAAEPPQAMPAEPTPVYQAPQ